MEPLTERELVQPTRATRAPVDRPVEAQNVAADGDRRRTVYLGACRIDVVRRAGTPRVLADAAIVRAVVRALEAAGAPSPASITLVLTDDEELRDLNRTHLERDETTDVLSFPMLPPDAYPDHPGRRPRARSGRSMPKRPEEAGSTGRTHVGDVAISLERAIQQAESGRGGQTGDVHWSPADELRLLVTHGTLHVCGWDHAEPEEERSMRELEQRLLAEDRR